MAKFSPGTTFMRSRVVSMPWFSSVAAVNACTVIGTSRTFSLRRSAVTIISSIDPAESAAAVSAVNPALESPPISEAVTSAVNIVLVDRMCPPELPPSLFINSRRDDRLARSPRRVLNLTWLYIHHIRDSIERDRHRERARAPTNALTRKSRSRSGGKTALAELKAGRSHLRMNRGILNEKMFHQSRRRVNQTVGGRIMQPGARTTSSRLKSSPGVDINGPLYKKSAR